MFSLFLGGNTVAVFGIFLLWLGSPLALLVFYGGCVAIFASAALGAAMELYERHRE